MDAAKISLLYLGSMSGTCLDRANALRRLGHDVHHLDPRAFLPRSRWVDRLAWRVGGGPFAALVTGGLKRALQGRRYDVCHVDLGEWFTAGHLQLLRRHAAVLVNYNIDDPTGARDKGRFSSYRRSIRHYDLAVVVRPENIAEVSALGARQVVCLPRAADEVSHAPRQLTATERRQWQSEVLFLGTWFPERGPFLLQIANHGIALTIRGSHWQKAPEWPALKRYWAGDALSGDAYAMAIQCAKVNLGLVSKGNRDLHTSRSLEVPALGALLCAERTPDHQAMYEEGTEALFWSDARECSAACRFALRNELTRQEIAAAGRRRIAANGHYNQVLMRRILDMATACRAVTVS